MMKLEGHSDDENNELEQIEHSPEDSQSKDLPINLDMPEEESKDAAIDVRGSTKVVFLGRNMPAKQVVRDYREEEKAHALDEEGENV